MFSFSYGLVDRVNCQHVFNLFCLYGNVNKIKFMKSKPGCGMIEFSDTEAVTRATENNKNVKTLWNFTLKNIVFFTFFSLV